MNFAIYSWVIVFSVCKTKGSQVSISGLKTLQFATFRAKIVVSNYSTITWKLIAYHQRQYKRWLEWDESPNQEFHCWNDCWWLPRHQLTHQDSSHLCQYIQWHWVGQIYSKDIQHSDPLTSDKVAAQESNQHTVWSLIPLNYWSQIKVILLLSWPLHISRSSHSSANMSLQYLSEPQTRYKESFPLIKFP